MVNSFPPRHICIAGAIVIAAGVSSIVRMVGALIDGRIFFDIGFVGIPIGYGVLMGSSTSRKWALALAAVAVLSMAALGGWALFDHFSGGDGFEYPENVYIILQVLIVSVAAVYVIGVLTRKSLREWFETDVPNDASSGSRKAVAWSIAVVAGALLVSQAAADWWMGEVFRRLYPFHVRVVPYDAETGESIRSMSYPSQSSGRPNSTPVALPRLQVSMVSDADVSYLELSGFAKAPFEYSFGSEGYETATVKVDEDTRGEIRVAMTPVKKRLSEVEKSGQPLQRPEVE